MAKKMAEIMGDDLLGLNFVQIRDLLNSSPISTSSELHSIVNVLTDIYHRLETAERRTGRLEQQVSDLESGDGADAPDDPGPLTDEELEEVADGLLAKRSKSFRTEHSDLRKALQDLVDAVDGSTAQVTVAQRRAISVLQRIPAGTGG